MVSFALTRLVNKCKRLNKKYFFSLFNLFIGESTPPSNFGSFFAQKRLRLRTLRLWLRDTAIKKRSSEHSAKFMWLKGKSVNRILDFSEFSNLNVVFLKKVSNTAFEVRFEFQKVF